MIGVKYFKMSQNRKDSYNLKHERKQEHRWSKQIVIKHKGIIDVLPNQRGGEGN